MPREDKTAKDRQGAKPLAATTRKRQKGTVEQPQTRVFAHGDLNARERAERAVPRGSRGYLAAIVSGDYEDEERPADLVAALGLVGTAVVVEGHTHLGHLGVGPVEEGGFDVPKGPVRGDYVSMTIPAEQFTFARTT